MVVRIIFFVLIFISATSLISQKFEIEDQIDVSKVPKPALSFIADIPFKADIKWYLEKSQKGTSFEAKTYYKGYLWSIEFTKDGLVQDMEMRIDFSEIPNNERERIKYVLAQTFKDYKVNKIQYHWEGAPLVLKQFLQNYPDAQELNRWYEIIITENTSSAWKQKEVLINPKGEIVQNLELITRPTDNMDF